VKTRWVFLLCVAVAGLAFGAGRLLAGGEVVIGPSGLDRYLDGGRLSRLLNLTPAQAAEIRSLGGEHLRGVQAACDRHCRARCALAVLVLQDDAPPAELRARVDEMCRAQADADLATVDHILKIRKVLTPEQQERFDRLLGQCLCGACTTGSGACRHSSP
jgi:Spy/CpxP family protein refolding chaperone